MRDKIREDIVMPELKEFKKEQAHKKHVLLWQKVKSTPKKFLYPSVLTAVLLAIGLGIFLTSSSDVPVQPMANIEPVVEEAQPEPEPAPELFASPLTGTLVPEEASQRPVTGVMIENGPQARPQSGLLEAGVVFEAIAEGGVTRFLSLYQESAPDYIGPVRSSRPYYVEWLAPFDAAYVHVGGDIAGRAAIAQYIDKDFDQFNYASSYTRIASRNAPHNVYTGFDRIDRLNDKSSTYTAWPRKDDSALEVPEAVNINLSISSSFYNPRYVYDQATNTYRRSQGSDPHVDLNSGTQIAPKVVVAMQMSNSTYKAEDGRRTRYNNIGSGKAWFFQDGDVVVGRWLKDSPTAQLKFVDNAGVEMQFNRGQTWISAVSGASW